MFIPVEHAGVLAVELHLLRRDSSPLHLKMAFAKVVFSPKKGQYNSFTIGLADYIHSYS